MLDGLVSSHPFFPHLELNHKDLWEEYQEGEYEFIKVDRADGLATEEKEVL